VNHVDTQQAPQPTAADASPARASASQHHAARAHYARASASQHHAARAHYARASAPGRRPGLAEPEPPPAPMTPGPAPAAPELPPAVRLTFDYIDAHLDRILASIEVMAALAERAAGATVH
jgi:hypothetical protein